MSQFLGNQGWTHFPAQEGVGVLEKVVTSQRTDCEPIVNIRQIVVQPIQAQAAVKALGEQVIELPKRFKVILGLRGTFLPRRVFNGGIAVAGAGPQKDLIHRPFFLSVKRGRCEEGATVAPSQGQVLRELKLLTAPAGELRVCSTTGEPTGVGVCRREG
jgi:hypothetical protein